MFVETAGADGTYATPEGPRPFDTHEELIRVRGGPDERLVVRETRHGPVLSDLDPAARQVLAVAMASLEVPDTAAAGLRALNRATTLEAAGAAAPLISAPVQNLLVADRADIGQFTTGRIPLRRAGDGTVPVDGADGRHDWTGFAEGAALPRVLRPASGRIVNANERVAGPDFPVFMGADWFGDWRARRIRTLLDGTATHKAAGFAAMQVDAVSSFAQAVLPALLATAAEDAAGQEALDALRRWDGAMRAERPEPLLFNAWIARLNADLLAGLGLADQPIAPAIDLVGQALLPGGEALCSGDCGALLRRSLHEALAALGPGWQGRSWGEAHQAVFAHPLLGRLPWIGGLFAWRVAQPGDDGTLFRGSPIPPAWTSVHGPAYRGVYDLADLDRSLFGLAPGQSGNPFSGTAASMMTRWRDGASIQLPRQPGTIGGRIEVHP